MLWKSKSTANLWACAPGRPIAGLPTPHASNKAKTASSSASPTHSKNCSQAWHFSRERAKWFRSKSKKRREVRGKTGEDLHALIALHPIQRSHCNPAIAKAHQLKPSRTARKSVSQPTSIMQPILQANACRPATKAICAVQASRRLRAAFFAYFFLLLKKSRSPKASKATTEAVRPNVLDKQCLFLIHP